MNKIRYTFQAFGNVRHLLFLSVAGLFLLSCDHLDRSGSGQKVTSGPPQPGPTQVSPLKEYTLVGGSSLQTSSSGVSGTGRLVFTAPLKFADNNYELSFNLNPEGSLTLLAATDSTLENGVSLKFSRKSDNKLLVQLTRGPESYDLSPDFSTVISNTPLNLSIDVHGHGHLMVWIGSVEIGQYAFSLPLTHKFWGLALDNSTVTKAEVGPAKVEG